MSNLILMTDSYKASHYKQYPPGTQAMFSYLESRGGKYDRTIFFGLQYLLRKYLSTSVTHKDVDEAKTFFAAHGTPFPEAGWRRIVDVHHGFLPVIIRAVSEGTAVPVSNVLLTVESTDPECFWIVTWIESFILRLWYPTTVATQSWHVRKVIRDYLKETATSEDGLNFKLHDFGARGVSSHESAGLGAAGHLAAGWMGSDTIEGILLANNYYDDPMAAFSIPASEHSTITAWGRDKEYAAFDNMLKQFGGKGKIVACVSDSYNIFEAVDYWISQSEKIKASGTTLVIRPDSGEPVDIVLGIMEKFRSAGLAPMNAKGYSELVPHFRVIQGDGVNPESIAEILFEMKQKMFSTDNLAFGMGGALLQQVNRDTQKFAFKCSAVKIDEIWQDVYKDPITDPGKVSKRGRLDLTGSIKSGMKTEVLTGSKSRWDTMLQEVYNNGLTAGTKDWLHFTSLEAVRERAAFSMDNGK